VPNPAGAPYAGRMDESRRDFWERLCDEYERGGGTLRDVAERHGVAPATFSHWRWRLKLDGRVGGRSGRRPAAATRSALAVRAVQVVAVQGPGEAPAAAPGAAPSTEPYLDARVHDVELRFVGYEAAQVVAVLRGLSRC